MSSIIELSDIDDYNEEDLIKMVSKYYSNYIILLKRKLLKTNKQK
jgi:hypothetical protein